MQRERGSRRGSFGGRFEHGGRDYGRVSGSRIATAGGEPRSSGAEHNLMVLQTSRIVSKPQYFESKKLARRPDSSGEIGRRLQVLANFFQMSFTSQNAYHYNIDIKPAGEAPILGEGDVAPTGQQQLPMTLCRAVLNECKTQHNWGENWTFDGKKNLFSPEELFDRHKSIFDVNMSDRPDQERIFTVTVTKASIINLHDIGAYLSGADISIPRNAIQALEVCLRFSVSNDPRCHLAGSSIYFNDPQTIVSLSVAADLWSGYHQSVKLCQHKLMLNMDTTYAAFSKRTAVLQLFEEALNGPLETYNRQETWAYQLMYKCVSNSIVKATHRQDTKKQRCRGLTNESASNLRFTLKDGRNITVAEYWQQNYGELQYPYLPCLDVSRGNRVSYLPPEVCEIVAGQRLLSLSEAQTRNIIRHGAKRPEDRKQQITNMLYKAGIPTGPVAHQFGITVNANMVTTLARMLPSPHVEYQQPESMDTGSRGAWNLEGVKFFRPAKIQSWAIVACAHPNVALVEGELGLQCFIDELIATMEEMGITVVNGRPPLVLQGADSIKEALEKGMADAEHMYQIPAEFILVLLERKESGPYQDVKRYADGPLGVVTQCIVAKSAGIGWQSRGRKQYLANLTMKINQKVGGVNTQITGTISNAIPVLGHGENKPFIVFGADVTHPNTFDKTHPSIGAIVASMDPFLGQYAARVLAMGHREEKMSMKESIKDLLRQFYRRNRVKPESVIFFRDGISEGQFQEVCEHEYNEIRAACQMLDENYKPPVTLIMVQKRHHTRLFPVNPGDGDGNGNVLPGTCIDTTITSTNEFDFYLNSHAGIQGTNKAAHYYVLIDENGFSSDAIQLFCYWICYLYCRCTRSVSYAPPAYYAHLAALHGRYLIGTGSDSSSEGSNNGAASVFHSNLDERMFFI